MPPFVLRDKHEVRSAGAEMDVDWTLCPGDQQMEYLLREERNQLIKEKLFAGSTACYRSSGWSLWPRVNSGDMTTYTPVRSADDVEVDDIVFCEVQPHNRFYAHLVKEKWWGDWNVRWKFTISNIKGWENGHCNIEHIYGKLIDVEP